MLKALKFMLALSLLAPVACDVEEPFEADGLGAGATEGGESVEPIPADAGFMCFDNLDGEMANGYPALQNPATGEYACAAGDVMFYCTWQSGEYWWCDWSNSTPF